MISATRRWLRRNRNGIVIATGVIGGTYIVGQYVIGKINEARERSSLDRIARENLRRRFEQNQTDCTFTVIALLPTVTENVLEALPVEQLTHELQQKKAERLARATGEPIPSELSSGPPTISGDTASLSSLQSSSYIHASQAGEDGLARPRKSKAQLWNEIKISSVTRAFTLIYTLSLLTLLTRIQLNLLGRLNYIGSVVSLTRPPPPGRANSISLEDNDDTTLNTNSATNTSANFGNDFETNRHFLTFSWFLLHRGYHTLLGQIQEVVTEVFGPISPTEAISVTRLSELILTIRRKIEGATEQERNSKRWLPYILPPKEQEHAVLMESGVITSQPGSSDGSPQPGPHSGSNIDTSTGPLRHLLDETADLIDSPTFTRIHTLLLNSLFSHLIDTRVAHQAFPAPSSVQSPPSSTSSTVPPPRITEILDDEPRLAVKLATILAVLTREAHAIGNGNNPPNEYLTKMEAEVKELEAFAAVIYASNFDADLENMRPQMERDGIVGSSGVGVSDVSTADEMLEGQLEGAWSRIMGASGLS